MSRLRSDEGRSGPGHDPDILEDPVPDASGDHDGLPMPCRFWAIVAISFGTALVVIDGAIANVALPKIARELNVGEGAVTSVITICRLVMVMGLLPFANLGDRIGLRKMYQIGQLMFCATSGPCFFAPSFSLLPLLRAGQALGAGMALAVAGSLSLVWMPDPASPFDIGWRLVLTALGYGLFVSPDSRLLIGAAPRERSAAAGGWLSPVCLLGQMMAAASVAVMLTLGVGTGPVPILFAAALGVVAALCPLGRFQSSRALGGERAAATIRS